nr:hypothetical protein BgiMline_008237 [Biomphalaria glabrata]
MDYFALFLCAGCVVLSGLVLNVESCLEQSRECVRLSQFQSIVDDQMPGNCKNLTKAKSCYDKVLRECKSANESRMISMARNSTEFQYNTYCFFDISQAGLQEGNQCARVMQTEEMRLDQLDQLCPKLSAALNYVARTEVQRPLCQHYARAKVEKEVLVLRPRYQVSYKEPFTCVS